MTPADIDRVFGRSRLRMVTGEHVEVFREESQPGERRRYTKRFLATPAGDFSEWTEREWRILARLVGHGIRPVPDVVQFDRGAPGRPALVQTYDAGVTVDHWATLLPLKRDGRVLRNVFEDCAHWWALARHCLVALDAIHELQLVHLDLKADNICIPVGAASFDPADAEQPLFPRFEEIALIDFAFSLVSGEALESPLPIAHQADYVYQSPRLLRALDAGRHEGDLRPTQELDWRCDLFSLAAMLWRYLPEMEEARSGMWTARRHAKARALVRRIMEAHDAPLPAERPHAELIAFAAEQLADPELTASLQRGWTLALDQPVAGADSPTPVTQIAPVPVAVVAAAAAAASAGAASAGAGSSAAEPVLPIRTEPVLAPPPELALTMTGAVPPAEAAPAPMPEAPISIDPSDIEDRDAGRHQRRRERSRHLAWGGALAVATVAGLGLALSSPAWLGGGPHERDRIVQAPAPAMPAELEAPARVARAPAPPPAPTDIAVTAPAASEKDAAQPKDASSAGVAPAPPAVAVARAPAPPVPAPPAAVAKSPVPPAPLAAARPAAPAVVAKAPAPGAAARSPAPAVTAKAPAPGAPRNVAESKASAAATRPAAVAKAPPPARPGGAVARPPLQAEARPRAAPRAFGDGALLPRQGPAPVAAGPSSTGPASTGPAPTGPVASTTRPDPFPAPAARGEATPVPRGTPAREPDPVAIATLPRQGAAAAAAALEPQRPSVPTPTLAPVDFGARAGELMNQHMPRLAQRAERQVLRVLFIAGRGEPAAADEDVADAAAALARMPADGFGGMTLAPHDGRLLAEAGQAELQRGRPAEALRLQNMAFGANPLDAEVAGTLAHVLLRQRPAQAETARQLALHALTLPDARAPQARVRDWTTLAVASALAGRDRDARNAWLVSLALAPNAGRQCKAAIDAYAAWGDRLRGSVEAMLQRASAGGRAGSSPFCEWPPHWVASTAGR